MTGNRDCAAHAARLSRSSSAACPCRRVRRGCPRGRLRSLRSLSPTGRLSSSHVTSTRSTPSARAMTSAWRRISRANPCLRWPGRTRYPTWPPKFSRNSFSSNRIETPPDDLAPATATRNAPRTRSGGRSIPCLRFSSLDQVGAPPLTALPVQQELEVIHGEFCVRSPSDRLVLIAQWAEPERHRRNRARRGAGRGSLRPCGRGDSCA